METIKLIEKKKNIQWNYDAEADVLYIFYDEPQKAEGIDLGNGTIARINPVTNEIVGFTLINPLQKTINSLNL